MRVLALSSSRVGNGGYLEAARPMIETFLGDTALHVAFIPFAAVDGDYENYAFKVREELSSLPHTVQLVTSENAKAVLQRCDVIMVGGGNTFKVLHDIYRQNIFSLIQEKVANGTPYIGWSAGSNLAGKTICTTNDMPIVQPQSFTAFGFLPLQINPHYYNQPIEGFHGETRDQRLAEFIQLNHDAVVVGLPEGTALCLEEPRLYLLGNANATFFRSQGEIVTKEIIPASSDLSFLLNK
jgi:dipeptidase E